MGIEQRQSLINGGQVIDKFLHATESATLTVNQNVVVGTTGAVVDVTLTLPAVVDAIGRIFTISLETDGGKDIVIQDADDSVNWTDLTLDTQYDYAILLCDGRRWWVLASEVA